MTEEWRRITAKFDSSCMECGQEVFTGDLILWQKGVGVKHETCPKTTNVPNELVVQDENFMKPRIWKDPERYKLAILEIMTKCQCCGVSVEGEKEMYIDSDRRVCSRCFGT